ncbi:DUF3025 domain-containing protein [Paraglaciecola aquimarina]|uniref:DUF3025 domain-containing protein n=1 Tax=Paraglaciecola algarum TaxID=3050085 RepID=A0ABS9D5H2_9ALTE|nr:DUF3025 domain-containing protein [Paraglaciecola sp. G1-23]MCF2948181.1 DUF3025 domain-containing protein [Paraglaciecola sp. G1-23]
MCEKWHKEYSNQLDMLHIRQLESLFSLTQFDDWPNAVGLNQLNLAACTQNLPEFVCQSQIEEPDLYYEQIIFQKNIVPTRPNSWHDLFNGLIWLQFPKTKRLLNQLHVQDIEQFGLSPRTLQRNNLTHFDECGVIITYEKSVNNQELISQLSEHQWHQVFVKNRGLWGKQLNAYMFGHANLEMLLAPFIGLTGKWLAIEVETGFHELAYQQQLLLLDDLLLKQIIEQKLFLQNKPLFPLPLLGIPEVWNANKDPEFYANTDYFRPKPKPRTLSGGLN